MENWRKQKIRCFANIAQLWDVFMFFFVVFIILSGIVYFFVRQFGQEPLIRLNREFAPAERGVLPENTFFNK
jgi:hypothetical protein